MTPRPLGNCGQPDQLPQGNHRVYGVVLRRREGSRAQELLLFLKNLGAVWISAPGAEGAKNRFGGGTEPLVWGAFDLYQSPRRLYLKSVDVREDFLALRASPKKLSAAVNWCRLLAGNVPVGHECDDLLSLLWGSLNYLALGVDPRLADLRFVWRWTSLWGIAPSLENCCACGERVDCPEGAAVARTADGLLCARCSAPSAGDVSSISLSLLQEIRHAVMLPRDRFLTWAGAVSPEIKEALGEGARWFYSFLEAHRS